MAIETDRQRKIGLCGIVGINKARVSVGVEPLIRGYRKCLRCDKEFFSDNLKTNKMCERCRCTAATQYLGD